MIEKDLVVSLKTVCERVYPLFMPQNVEFPAMTYQVIYDGTEQSVKGDICGRDARFQVDIYSRTYSEAKSLKQQTVNNIIDLKGGEISSQDLYDDDTELYRQLIDFKIKE